MQCPAETDLRLFLDGELHDPVHQQVGRHIDTCPLCQARLDTLTTDFDAAFGHNGSDSSADVAEAPLEELRVKSFSDRQLKKGL